MAFFDFILKVKNYVFNKLLINGNCYFCQSIVNNC